MRPLIPLVFNRRTALRQDGGPGLPRGRFIPTVRPRATVAEVVKPLPRRIPLLSEGAEFDSPRDVRYQREVLHGTPFILVRRLLAWLGFFARLFLGNLWDQIRGRATLKRRAVRLRLLLEGLGTTAIKIGQLITVNAQAMPVEFGDELEKLFDSVPAMPPDQAIAIIEAEQRRSIRELFSRFDPVPLAGGAIACVYQAVLLTGEQVAVKVRRPGIERSFRADFRVLRLLHGLAEFLGLARSSQTGSILAECQRMLNDEMDLRLEARQIEVFRKTIKDRIDFITAPRVFHAFTCTRVLVTEMVEGMTVREILNAIRKNNHDHLAQLTQLGYDFRRISKRLLHLFYWQTFESMVFHADLSPANIIITPDQRIMLVDFGCCGTIPPKYRRNIYAFMKSVEAGDLAGAVRNAIGLSEPLPPIDVQKYTFEMTGLMRDYLVNVRSEHVPWQEKCNFNAFHQAQTLGHRYGVPLRPELLRYFRSVRHIDYMVYRLNPKVDLTRQFRKYFEKRAEVARHKARKAFKDTVSLLYDNLSVDAESMARTALTGISRLQDLTDSGGFQFGTALQKLPYVFSMIMTTVFRALVLVMVVAAIKTIRWEITRPEDHVLTYWDHMFSVTHSYTIETLLVFFGLIAFAKIVTRLRQADVDK
jgi:ubiquinone biosynthesis protein